MNTARRRIRIDDGGGGEEKEEISTRVLDRDLLELDLWKRKEGDRGGIKRPRCVKEVEEGLSALIQGLKVAMDNRQFGRWLFHTVNRETGVQTRRIHMDSHNLTTHRVTGYWIEDKVLVHRDAESRRNE